MSELWERALQAREAQQGEEAPTPTPAPGKKPRGFACLDRRRVSEIARMGGKAATSRGLAHRFSSEEAKEAGRKGGLASHAAKRARAAQGDTR